MTTKRPAAEAAPLAPTPAAAFRRGGLYQLPHSGHVVRLRFPGLYALAMRGDVPNGLSNAVLRLVSGASAEESTEDAAARRIAAYRENARAFLEVAALCLEEPRLILDEAPNYERGEIGPRDLPEQDLLWIFLDFVQGGPAGETVAPFRRD